ncbi:MAG: response regulator [Opitutaceae bacterium]|jgi:CheY-like chemotaxis protein
MNLVKKILLVHSEAKTRRVCLMLLAGAGFDVRAYSSAASAAEGAQGEWFDLALLDHKLPDAPEFGIIDRLRKIQPTLPVIMLVNHLEFPLVVQGIRQGVSDVLPLAGDLSPVVSRVCAFFNVVPCADSEVSSDELKQAEDILECMGGVGGTPTHHPYHAPSQSDSSALLDAAREKTLLERQIERLGFERNALEAQLKTLLAQNGDLAHQQDLAAELRSQREIVAAAQAAIDAKARQLAEQRAALNREKGLLGEERRQLRNSSPAPSGDEAQTASERDRLAEWQRKLADQAEQLHVEATRLQQDRAQLASERRSWHRDLDTLRDQEDNLRRYEARLREMQARLEADQVGLIGAQTQNTLRAQPADDASLKDAWAKFQRTTELFELEKTHLREERLAFRDWEKALKLKELSLSTREAKIGSHEQRMKETQNAKPPAPPPAPDKVDFMRSFTRAPFAAAKAAFMGNRDQT